MPHSGLMKVASISIFSGRRGLESVDPSMLQPAETSASTISIAEGPDRSGTPPCPFWGTFTAVMPEKRETIESMAVFREAGEVQSALLSHIACIDQEL